MSRDRVADFLLVEHLKWHGGLPAHGVVAGEGFDPARQFARRLETFRAVGLLDDDEAAEWRRRFAEPNAPAPKPVVDEALRGRAERYLESLLPTATGDDDAFWAALNVATQVGVLSRGEAREWCDRAIEDDDREPEAVDVRDRDLRGVLLAPPHDVDEFRVVSVELYPKGILVNWVGPGMIDLALSDDGGTVYELADVEAGGSEDRRLRGEASFTPALPSGATRLDVEIAGRRMHVAVPS